MESLVLHIVLFLSNFNLDNLNTATAQVRSKKNSISKGLRINTNKIADRDGKLKDKNGF